MLGIKEKSVQHRCRRQCRCLRRDLNGRFDYAIQLCEERITHRGAGHRSLFGDDEKVLTMTAAAAVMAVLKAYLNISEIKV